MTPAPPLDALRWDPRWGGIWFLSLAAADVPLPRGHWFLACTGADCSGASRPRPNLCVRTKHFTSRGQLSRLLARTIPA